MSRTERARTSALVRLEEKSERRAPAGRVAGLEGAIEMFRQRIRLCYSVEGDKRFLSHHDMMRLWHRALRRSGLPLRMTEGFHVRPRVSFAMARGVGIASECEWMEFELADWVNPDSARRELSAQLPAGIGIRRLAAVAPGDRAVVRAIRYLVHLPSAPDDLDVRVAQLLDRAEIVVERGSAGKRRSVDLRPLVSGLQRRGNDLRIDARCTQAGSLRPDEVLAELGFGPDEIARSLVVRQRCDLDGDAA